jgi:predicted nucleic acid-binding protein
MPSTPTEALLDVNVIIASVFADHVMHLPARRFVESLDRFYTTPTVQGGFLRFATRPVKNELGDLKPRLRMLEALATLQAFTEVEAHVFASDDVPLTDLGLRSLQGHRQWTDAYLLHIARKKGLMLASLESRMATLDNPEAPVLFVVENQ